MIGGLDARHGYAIAQRSELDAWRHATADIPPELASHVFRTTIIRSSFSDGRSHAATRVTFGVTDSTTEEDCASEDSLSGELSWRFSAPFLNVEWVALRAKIFPLPSAGRFTRGRGLRRTL